MRTYFPDDPIKQEMIECLIREIRKNIKDCLSGEYPERSVETIEKATGEKIEEVLK